jgi:hypothetical protein
MEIKKNFGVFAKVQGVDICYGTATCAADANSQVKKLDQQTYKIPEGRPVPVFEVKPLNPDQTGLWWDGRSRKQNENGNVVPASGKTR